MGCYRRLHFCMASTMVSEVGPEEAQALTERAPPQQHFELPGLEGRWTLEQLVEMELQRDPWLGQASLCTCCRRLCAAAATARRHHLVLPALLSAVLLQPVNLPCRICRATHG